jgi:hypothetical protein
MTADPPRHHKPLPKRVPVALTEQAYANLRALAAETGLGNNYVLTVLLEDMDRTIDRDAFRRAAREMLARHRRDEG